jgi:hypothetical protein
MHAAGQDTEISLALMGLVAALCDWSFLYLSITVGIQVVAVKVS